MIPGILTPPPLQRETGASFIGSETNFSTSSTLSTLGAAANDLLIVLVPQSGSPTLSSGNALTGVNSRWHYRVMNSSDIAGTVSLIAGSGAAGLVIYRGAASIASVATDGPLSGSYTDRSLAGFTKNGSHAGLIAMIYTGGDVATLSISSPPSWTQRASYDPSGTAVVDSFIVTDRLQPANPTYINSTAFLWSTSDGGTLDILELRT